ALSSNDHACKSCIEPMSRKVQHNCSGQETTGRQRSKFCIMKQSTHFRPEQYSNWFNALTQQPSRIGWDESRGFRLDGFLQLYWDGGYWVYFGAPHSRADFPSFGEHETDQFRGLSTPDFRSTKRMLHDDITGQRFGRLVAEELAYISKRGATWLFAC